ncbi:MULTISPECIES: DMT family transporter [Halorussus]|uniref:DMT family transporter n=1 Tax=Halorussus TaxID=1070314 RepID=UPI0020A0C43E|nr:EamA family transporter [Halorussus vallis]USZ75976.1 EamA family transporter [Halorussus vallis]
MIPSLIRSYLSRTSVLFVLLATFWGGSFVAIEVGLHHFPPLYFAGIRYAVAGAVVLGYAAVTTDRWRPAHREDWLSVTVVGALIIAAYHGLLYVGELHVSGTVAAVVVSLSPVLTAAFAAALLDERLTLVKVAGFGLGVAGVAVVAGFSPSNLLATDAVGVGLVFLGGACFALGAVLIRPLRTDFSLAAMEGWGMVGGAAALLVGGAFRGESLAAIDPTPTALASLAYLTLVSGVVAFLVYFALLDRVGATQINLVGYAEPVVATLVSWALLGQFVGARTAAGFLVIFAGFALVEGDALAGLVRSALPIGDAEDSAAWSGDAGPADD